MLTGLLEEGGVYSLDRGRAALFTTPLAGEPDMAAKKTAAKKEAPVPVEENELACIVQAVARVRDECEHVEKDARNTFHKYDYASEAAITRAVRPLLAKHGLVIIQSVAIDPPPTVDDAGVTHMVLEFTLAHENGTVWPDVLRVATQGNDRDSKGLHGDMGAFKANTGGYKYFLNRLFMLDTGDDPERGEKPAQKRERKKAEPKPAERKTGEPRGDDDPPFHKIVWTAAWKRAGAIGSEMSEDVHKELAVEIISVTKAYLKVEKVNEVLGTAKRDAFLHVVAGCTLNEDGGAQVTIDSQENF